MQRVNVFTSCRGCGVPVEMLLGAPVNDAGRITCRSQAAVRDQHQRRRPECVGRGVLPVAVAEASAASYAHARAVLTMLGG